MPDRADAVATSIGELRDGASPGDDDLQRDRLALRGAVAGALGSELAPVLALALANLDDLIDVATDGAHGRLEETRTALLELQRGLRDLQAPTRGAMTRDASPAMIVDAMVRLCRGLSEIRVVRAFAPTPAVAAPRADLGHVVLAALYALAPPRPSADALLRVAVEPTPRGWVRIMLTASGGERTPARGLDYEAIARRMTNALGGVFVVSATDERHQIEIELPPRAAVAPSAGRDELRARVLVIDDDAQMGGNIARALRASHDLTFVTSGAAALELIEGGAAFDVLFCDLKMPDVSGIDVYDALLRIAPGQAARIVFITGGAFTAHSLRFLESLTNPTLAKPFAIADLRGALREVLEHQGPHAR